MTRRAPLRHIETGKTLEREMVERDGRIGGYSYGETMCGRWFWYGQAESWAAYPGAPMREPGAATCSRCLRLWRAEQDADR